MPPGQTQGESYAQNLRAPLLLLTNGRDLEVWQLKATLESQRVLQIPVSQLAESRGQIERFLNKTAVRDYCKALEFKTIVEATADFGKYETAELARLMSGPPAVGRTLTLKQAGGEKFKIDSDKLLGSYLNGAIVVGSSGYGKTTLSRSIVKQAIEERWRGRHTPFTIEAPLPDIEASGANFLQFLHQRLQAHLPGVTAESFRDLLRMHGATVICDSLDRTSAVFQRGIATAVSLFLRDYPLSQVFVFTRADVQPTIHIPTLALEPLSDIQMRELEKTILADGSAEHYSVIGAMSPTLRSLCSNPLLLKLSLEYWQRHNDFPRDFGMLFQSWLDTVLETEPNDPVSRLRRQRALSIIAQATTEAPLPGDKVTALLKIDGIDETVLNELIRCDAVRLIGAVLELQHDSLADYLRAKAYAEKSVPDQIAVIPGVTVSRDSFLPILLMAQLSDQSAQAALWKHMLSGPIDTYFEALRYRRDASDELGCLDARQLSLRYMTDLLNGIEEPLDGFFPALRPAIAEWLTNEREKPLAIVGTANAHDLTYKIHAQKPNASRVVAGAPDFPGTIRGVSLNLSRYRTDSARLLGMSLLGHGLEEIIKSWDVEGGLVWASERLIARVRFLAERYNFPISTTDELNSIERVIRPYAGQVMHEPPLVGDAHFTFQSMLDDIAKLQTAGINALDPWWARLGWTDYFSKSSLSDASVAQLLDEEYRRTQLIYKEIIEGSFSRFSADMIFYPILPLRWKLQVVRGDPMRRTFVIYPRWVPVRDWDNAGADVTFTDRGPEGFPPWEEASEALIALGRPPNVPHYGGFTTHAGYSGSELIGRFTGATPATNEAISWLKEEMKRLFRNLPSGDGAFAV